MVGGGDGAVELVDGGQRTFSERAEKSWVHFSSRRGGSERKGELKGGREREIVVEGRGKGEEYGRRKRVRRDVFKVRGECHVTLITISRPSTPDRCTPSFGFFCLPWRFCYPLTLITNTVEIGNQQKLHSWLWVQRKLLEKHLKIHRDTSSIPHHWWIIPPSQARRRQISLRINQLSHASQDRWVSQSGSAEAVNTDQKNANKILKVLGKRGEGGGGGGEASSEPHTRPKWSRTRDACRLLVRKVISLSDSMPSEIRVRPGVWFYFCEIVAGGLGEACYVLWTHGEHWRQAGQNHRRPLEIDQC